MHKARCLFSVMSMFCATVCFSQQPTNPLTAKADSLFMLQQWQQAKTNYEAVLTKTTINPLAWNRLGFSNYHTGDYETAMKNYATALAQQPSVLLKSVVYSRMARIYAIKKMATETFNALDSALYYGYSNYAELDTLKDFVSVKNSEAFRKARENAYNNYFPCMQNKQAREFDFWIGEWDVYQTGTKSPIVGHSLIQMISGGCAILENWDSPASNGKSINFIDPVSGKWKQSWSGSYANGNQEFVNGEYKDGAMRFEYSRSGPARQKVIGRFIFYNQGPGQVRQFNEFSADNGKTWTTSYDFTYVRRK